MLSVHPVHVSRRVPDTPDNTRHSQYLNATSNLGERNGGKTTTTYVLL